MKPAMFFRRSLATQPSRSAAVPDASPSLSERRVLRSHELFDDANELLIEHAGFTYRLRITQANKLIQTK
jgi:hemin uptake protein HemP